jgi:hypothetical protein
MPELGEGGYYEEKEEVELGKGGFYEGPEKKPLSFDLSSLKKLWWVFILIVLVVVGYFAFNLFSTSGQGGSVFLLKVASGNNIVSGARVVALMNGVQVGAGVTGGNGIVSMALPNGNVNFEVEGSGYVSRNVSISTSKASGIVFLSATAPSVFNLKVVDDQGFPVVGAGVFYYFSDPSNENSVYTDSSGSASIQTLGNNVIFVRVIKSGYQSASLSVLTTRNEGPVVLRKLNNTGLQFGNVTVNANSSSGLLSVYDASSQTLISNSSLSGSVVFSLPLGEQVFFGVTGANGFYDYNGFVSGDFYNVSDGLNVNLNLTVIPVVYTGAWLNSFDVNNNSVSASVDVVSYPSLVGSVLSSNGSLFVPLVNGTFYAIFSSPGFVVSRSGFFGLGGVVNQTLVSANSSNSGNLNVEVVDENGAPLQGVQVLVSDGGLLSDAPSSTDSTGSAVFNDLPLSVFNVTASLDGLTVAQSVDLNVNSSVTLVLSVHSAFFNVSAVNALTGGAVSAVFNSFYGNNSFDSCSGFSCLLRVWGGSGEQVKASANGFLNYTVSLNDVKPLSSNSLAVRLVPESAVTGMLVDFVGVKDGSGKFTTALVAGENYTFDFYIARSNAKSVGIYVRIGGSGGLNGGFIDASGFSGAGVGVETGGFLSDPQPECVDLNSSVASNAKWVELIFPSESEEVLIPFTVDGNFSGNLQVFYRGFGLSNGFYSRYPEDVFLGGNFSSSAMAECYAQTTEKDFLVLQPNANASTNQTTGVFFNSSNYSNGDYVFYKQGVGISSASGSLNYVLQADPVMPGDVFNFSLENDANCKILIGNFSGGDSNCFYYDNNKGLVVFSASPLNKNCPVQVEGNGFIDSSGPITSVSTLLKIGATCNVNTQGYANFTVNLASIPSFYLLPTSSDWNGGPGLNYLLNEMQAPRVLSVNGVNFSFNSSGVQAFEWKGNGSLSVSESGLELASQTYSSNGSSFLANGNSIIGSVAGSCSDQFCCSSGWCQNSTFNSMLSFFNSSVSSLANQTVFRRGGNLPFSYFYPSANASFYTVAQLSQGVSTGCSGNPGVFKTELSGNGSGWALSLTPLNVSASLTSNCNPVQLCGFISGLNGCIVNSSNANPLSLDQLQKLTFNLVNCMYPVFNHAPVCYLGYSALLPRVELGVITTTAPLTSGENFISKLRDSLFKASNVDFNMFKNFGQNTFDCNIPVDFPTTLLTRTIGNSVCSDSTSAASTATPSVNPQCNAAQSTASSSTLLKFFGTLQGSQSNAVFNSLNPLVAVYCSTPIIATCCTPKQGSILLSVKDNQVYLMIAWGVNVDCNPVFPLASAKFSSLCDWGPTVAGGLMSYLSSNGADFEVGLTGTDFTSKTKPASTTQ